MVKKVNYFLIFLGVMGAFSATAGDYSKLYGQWRGIQMFQDENSYDGKTFFLPNEGEMILDENTVRLYYYPYFKSAEFEVTYTGKSIYYQINDKQIRCDYSFQSDTLVFEMYYINKTFVKFFTRVDLDPVILADLDRYGYRTKKLVFEFELDTLHPDQRKGFLNYDSLGFIPFQHLRFSQDDTLVIDGTNKVMYQRDFHKIIFNYRGETNELQVEHLSGTQDIFLKPITQCQCDSIILPYMSVKWADRIRQAIIDEENF